MRMDPTIKSKHKPAPLNRGVFVAAGIASIVVSLLILGFCLFESFGRGLDIKAVEVPGFHELKLNNAGLYAGVYQHRGAGPLPVAELSKLDVHILSKDDYQEVPVFTNTTGQTISQLGQQGMPLFNFVIERPGEYTLSAVYQDDVKGPVVQVLVFPPTVRNIKQTLIVGGASFLVFLGLGIFILVRLNRWAPKTINP